MFLQKWTPMCGPESFGRDFDGNMERLFEDFFLDRGAPVRGGDDDNATAVPAVDILSGKDSFVVTFDMPGVKKEDIDVALDDEVLTVKGARKTETEEADGEYVHRERTRSEFKRSVRVSAKVNEEGIKASLTDGVLTVTLPRAAEEGAHRIEVKAN